jgi:hypothetical protein
MMGAARTAHVGWISGQGADTPIPVGPTGATDRPTVALACAGPRPGRPFPSVTSAPARASRLGESRSPAHRGAPPAPATGTLAEYKLQAPGAPRGALSECVLSQPLVSCLGEFAGSWVREAELAWVGPSFRDPA